MTPVNLSLQHVASFYAPVFSALSSWASVCMQAPHQLSGLTLWGRSCKLQDILRKSLGGDLGIFLAQLDADRTDVQRLASYQRGSASGELKLVPRSIRMRCNPTTA